MWQAVVLAAADTVKHQPAEEIVVSVQGSLDTAATSYEERICCKDSGINTATQTLPKRSPL